MVDRSPALAVAQVLPVAFLGLMMLVATWWDSAFDLRYWAPLTILAVGLLLIQILSGTLSLPWRGPLALSVAAIWCFAGFELISAAWSPSPALAWAEAARCVFYATLWTLGAGLVAEGSWRQRLASGLALGVGAIAIATVLGMLIGGADLFRAGRLESPIGYRNATAALFAFAAWPLIGFAARRGGSVGFRAASLSLTVLVLGLAFLTQSRGVLIGLVCGGVVSLAIGPDRLRRVWVAIAAVAAIAVGSSSLLSPYHQFENGVLTVGDGVVGDAAVTLILLSAAALVVGVFAAIFDNGLRSATLARRLRLIAAVGLALVAVAGVAGGLAAVGDPIDYIDGKVEEFDDVESANSGSTRLGSVGGQRSDLWRVAWDEFRADPLVGAGVGGFQFAYYRDRETDRNLSDSHSLPLRLLAETGLVGAALFLAWLVAMTLALVRRVRAAAPAERVWIAGLAAAGATVLAQCVVDWLWLLPGLIGLAILALALASGGGPKEQRKPQPGRSPLRFAFAAGLLAVVVSVTFIFLGNVYARKARVEANRSPAAELDAARTAAFFIPVAVTPHYLQASALETMGREAEAREALEDALELEPENFVTLALLGDFYFRAGDDEVSRRYYRRALALNPLDVGLVELSRGKAR
jgi:hypothetical protein